MLWTAETSIMRVNLTNTSSSSKSPAGSLVDRSTNEIVKVASAETSLADDGALVTRTTGDVVKVASSETTLASNGVLVNRSTGETVKVGSAGKTEHALTSRIPDKVITTTLLQPLLDYFGTIYTMLLAELMCS